MKVNAPEKIYIPITEGQEIAINEWGSIPLSQYEHKRVVENIEYTRTDFFIKMACEWLNEHTVLSEKWIIENFKKYMEEQV